MDGFLLQLFVKVFNTLTDIPVHAIMSVLFACSKIFRFSDKLLCIFFDLSELFFTERPLLIQYDMRLQKNYLYTREVYYA